MDLALPIAHDRPSLLTHPQEIQDMIFRLAYPRQTKFTIITKKEWNFREKSRRRELGGQHIPRAYPPPHANGYVVSKAFFTNAARAFIGNQCFSANSGTKVDMDLLFSCIITRCESLQNLTVTVRPLAFEMARMDLFDELLDEQTLEQSGPLSALLSVRGLKQFKLKVVMDSRRRTPEQMQTWDANMARMELLIRANLLLPKKRATTDIFVSNSRATPLYAGSGVSASCSPLLRCHGATARPAPRASEARSIFDIGTAESSAGTRKLCTDDIPEELEKLHLLLLAKGAELVDWIREAKVAKKQADGR
ncbi:hypothetical protein LTR85_002059 [Meristemomyces frigidus]|nr:hypothetical protein LTR85_002059 [Meristemomyces frigidus]